MHFAKKPFLFLSCSQNRNSRSREHAAVAVDKRRAGVWNLPRACGVGELMECLDDVVNRRNFPRRAKTEQTSVRVHWNDLTSARCQHSNIVRKPVKALERVLNPVAAFASIHNMNRFQSAQEANRKAVVQTEEINILHCHLRVLVREVRCRLTAEHRFVWSFFFDLAKKRKNSNETNRQ
jgi:hypothetical protein